MKLDSSNGRYSIIIAGILVIMVTSIFLACAFGIWDNNLISSNDIRLNNSDISLNNGNMVIENNHYDNIFSGVGFLPLPQKACKEVDTEDKGWIFVDGGNVPTTMPLMLTAGELNTWYLTVYSFGDYNLDGGSLDIVQSKYPDLLNTLDVDGWTITHISDFNIPDGIVDDVGVEDINMLVDKWIIDFYTPGEGVLDSDAVQYFASNHLPELYGQTAWLAESCSCPDPSFNPDRELGKEVKLKVCMDWSGCNQVDQTFKVILAYISMRRSPQLPIKIFIAS